MPIRKENLQSDVGNKVKVKVKSAPIVIGLKNDKDVLFINEVV